MYTQKRVSDYFRIESPPTAPAEENPLAVPSEDCLSPYEEIQEVSDSSGSDSSARYYDSEESDYGSESEDSDEDTVLLNAISTESVSSITRLVLKADTEQQLRVLLNSTSHWTEVDYKMSGFSKSYEWYSLTPLARAAKEGKDDIVAYLLGSGLCDPTLQGCASDDVYMNAYEAVHSGIKESQLKMKRILDKTYAEYHFEERVEHLDSRKLLRNEAGLSRCRALLEAVAPFWERADYAGASYNKARKSCGFYNTATDIAEMQKALEKVPGRTATDVEQESLLSKVIAEIKDKKRRERLERKRKLKAEQLALEREKEKRRKASLCSASYCKNKPAMRCATHSCRSHCFQRCNWHSRR